MVCSCAADSPLGLSQHVSGLGITLFATSLSYFSYRTALPDVSVTTRIEPFQPLDIPILSELPFLVSIVSANSLDMVCARLCFVRLVCNEQNSAGCGN